MSPDVSQQGRGPDVRILRSDRLKIKPRTRICVSTYADPATLNRVAAGSGEKLELYLDGFSMQTASALTQELRYRGLPTRLNDSAQSLRVLDLVQNNRESDCMRGPDAIRLKQEILPDDLGRAYRVRVTASQKNRLFVAEITRKRLIPISDEERILLPQDGDTRFDGSMFWDVRHDINKLRSIFIDYIFQEAD